MSSLKICKTAAPEQESSNPPEVIRSARFSGYAARNFSVTSGFILGLTFTGKIKNLFIKQVNVFALITIKTLFLYFTYQGAALKYVKFQP